MARTWTSGRVASAIVAAGILMAGQLTTTPARAAHTAKGGKVSGAAKGGVHQNLSSELRPVGRAATKVRGTTPSIELNVDTTTEDAQLSLISYTFTGGAPVKFAFGNRFTLSNDQAPFKLSAVAAFLAKRSDNSEGFQVGEPIGIHVFVDATSSGDISKAVNVFSGSATVGTEDSFNVYSLPAPIVVKQGDIYIMFADLTTDTEATQLPVVLPENGGSSDARSFVNLSPSTGGTPGQYGLATDTLTVDSDPFTGNFAVRGLGDPAEASDLVTGGGEAVDSTLPSPSNLTAIGTTTVDLSWTSPTLPPPPAPTPVSEVEPNDSPATAQMIGTNDLVTGSAKDTDPGSDGGFGGEDVEDWYEFTLAQAGSITISLTDFGATNDFDLLLYTPDGPFNSDNAVAFSGGGAGEDELIDLPVLAAGTYVIAVSAFDGGGVPTNQSYKLTVVAAPKVTRFNVYCGPSETFTPSAETFIATVPGSQSNFTVAESAAGAYYRVTAVVGATQSGPSNGASGTPCEGGPTFTSVAVKRNGQGTITLKGASGDLTGITLTINGVGFSKAPKVKTAKAQVKQKGPLANGQTVGQACPSGCTITIMTNAGCSTVTAP